MRVVTGSRVAMSSADTWICVCTATREGTGCARENVMEYVREKSDTKAPEAFGPTSPFDKQSNALIMMTAWHMRLVWSCWCVEFACQCWDDVSH